MLLKIKKVFFFVFFTLHYLSELFLEDSMLAINYLFNKNILKWEKRILKNIIILKY